VLPFGSLSVMTVMQLVRQDRGLSKAEAARLVRMLPEAYSLIERGLLSPNPPQSERIERAFGHPIESLLEAVPHPPPLASSRLARGETVR
jgi:transcriptional regulator with XRE-family HTH domain